MKSSRRVFGFLVALSVAVLSAAIQPISAAASTSGTLFGFAASGIVKVDPATGALTQMASVSVPNLAGFGSSLVDDPATHRLFLVRNVFVDQTVFPPLRASQIVTIDSQSGVVNASPNLTQSLVDLVFDPSSRTLLGLTPTSQIVRVDPAGGGETPVASLTGNRFSSMTVAPATHSLYVVSLSFASFPPTATLLSVDTVTGTVSQGPALNTGVFALVYDSSAAALFAKTFCCPAHIVRIDTSSGVETPVGQALGLGSGFAIDSASHTIFLTDDELGAFSFNQFILSLNDQTGASSISGALPTNNYVGSLVFEPVLITPDSIRADVTSALASGAISNAGIANSLLAELNAAQDARSRGQCSVAANVYQAFINEVNAQSGKAIAPATATQLVIEAQFLIAHCP
jgi:hypothetical protein